MHSCSKRLTLKDSKPKMSSKPTTLTTSVEPFVVGWKLVEALMLATTQSKART